MRIRPIQAGLAGLAFAGFVAFAGTAARADMINYTMELKGANEVPSTDSQGTGSGTASYDTATKTLSWDITYSGLSGPAAAAHFHGPAGPGENAKPVVPLSGDLASPIKGSVVFNADQDAAISGGKWDNWYFNIHTETFPDGEIRGQVVKAP
jgi:hypothetical protein